MKNLSGALITLLATSKNLYVADLFTFTRKDAIVARYTSFDKDIVFGGNTYLSSVAQISRNGLTVGVGLEVGNLELEIVAASTSLVNGVPILQSFARGEFDGADVRLETVYMPTVGDVSAGSEIKFVGRVSTIDEITESSVTVTCKDLSELFNQNVPLHVLQPACYHTLFDVGCGLTRATFEINTTATGASTVNQIVTAALGQASGYFDLGVLQFTSGVLNTLKFPIRQYINPGTFFPNAPLPAAPANGDGIRLIPGCDKTLATCIAKFANKANYGGQDFVPKPETAI
jgi:uncharacterized phage protein (TIGR02218 family)